MRMAMTTLSLVLVDRCTLSRSPRKFLRPWSRHHSKRPSDFQGRHDVIVGLGPIVEELRVDVPHSDFVHVVQEQTRETVVVCVLVQSRYFVDRTAGRKPKAE
jgi:hypothetical protein